ncbi:hypothetical protein K458DRAFT_432558 [Lentithecium fluviatile CBS 122367]|uniref:Uncharacterized protein n=1 Tax=Lentithecium fluviatile CBS 122367 TaxID=1168545 RepID=A0A6G1IX48_9PLEO|nr:hypothetical protein K458DRAFT_432558 [Lentithecium fluviatile CBS 122367]
MGENKDDVPPGGYATAMKRAEGWKELRIGTLDPEKFRYNKALQTPVPEAIEQIKMATIEGYNRIKKHAKEYHYDVSLRLDKGFNFEGMNALIELIVTDFELAAWNEAHAESALPSEYPNQDFITRSVAFDQSDRREKLMKHILEVGKSLPDTLDKYQIDAIFGPSDSWFSKYSAATGFSLCALTLG